MPSVMSPIDCSNARMRACRLTALPMCLVLLGLLAAASLLPGSPCWLAADEALAASAYTPRHSGMDAPGEPKRIESLPSKNAGRTAEGGMGYTDAYGNTIDDRQPEEKPAPKRPRPGAYGVGAGQSERYERPLPDPQNQTPAWSFK
ncbi:translation initiation factor IF-2 [Desulfovibrio sp.]|mgnify:FL=1|uniref:translation initiation factor IF-2 n=2 Tax=Desulfovibrio TaxID=872 RepID=UPI002602FEAE|nr:translation initiation factor IF-2 [Desulfovibrio sp.]